MAPKISNRFVGFVDQVGEAMISLLLNKRQRYKRRQKKGPQFKWIPRPRPSKNDEMIIALIKVGPWLDSMRDDQINPEEEERQWIYANSKPDFSDRERWTVLIEL